MFLIELATECVTNLDLRIEIERHFFEAAETVVKMGSSPKPDYFKQL